MKIVSPTTMLSDAIQFIKDAPGAVVDAVLWPGHQAVAAISYYSPGTAAWLGISAAEPPPPLMSFLLSLLLWFLAYVAIVLTFKLLSHPVRFTEAMIRTARHRATSAARRFKTMLLLRFGRIFRSRRKLDDGEIPIGNVSNVAARVTRPRLSYTRRRIR